MWWVRFSSYTTQITPLENGYYKGERVTCSFCSGLRARQTHLLGTFHLHSLISIILEKMILLRILQRILRSRILQMIFITNLILQNWKKTKSRAGSLKTLKFGVCTDKIPSVSSDCFKYKEMRRVFWFDFIFFFIFF